MIGNLQKNKADTEKTIAFNTEPFNCVVATE